MFWKILFFLYVAFVLSISVTGVTQTPDIVKNSVADELFAITIIIFWVLALVYTYALGWKKQLINKVHNKYILYCGIGATILTGIYLFMTIYPEAYNETLMYGMREGLAPRNMGFQFVLTITRTAILILSLIYLFLLYTPFFLGYYFYGKNMSKFGELKFAGRKIFTCFMFADIFPVILLFIYGTSGVLAHYNVYDFLTVVCMGFTLSGLYGYAFNKKIFTQDIWKVIFPLLIVLTLIPQSFLSSDFIKIIGGINTFQSSPLICISDWAITIGALYLIYKYAYTDEVFGITAEQNKAVEEIPDSQNNEDKYE